MRAMLLAAGRGARLRPLTDSIPKPLVELAGKTLIEHHLEALAGAGFEEIVINVAYRGEQIVDKLGEGGRYGLHIQYSREEPGELDTGGGIVKALPLLGDAPFAVINSDIFTDYPYAELADSAPQGNDDMHLVVVPNPPHKKAGDFDLRQGRVSRPQPRFTFAGIGIYHPRVFEGLAPGRRGLAELLFAAADEGRAAGGFYQGRWFDVGTWDSLNSLRETYG